MAKKRASKPDNRFLNIPILVTALLVFTLVALFSYRYFWKSTDDRTDAAVVTGLGNNYFEVGPEEVVMDVSDLVTSSPILGIDAPVITMRTSAGVQGFLSANRIRYANGSFSVTAPAATYRFRADSLDRVFSKRAPERFKLALDGATTPTPVDSGGAWMMSVVPLDANTILGWYHAEAPSSDPSMVVKMQQVATISRDGGRTWQSLGPVMSLDPSTSQNSKVESGWQFSRDDINTNAITKVGNYYYMGFLHLRQQTGFARAAVSDVHTAMLNNRPGDAAWKKYLCSSGVCGFTSPGIGGAAQPAYDSSYGQGFAFNGRMNRFMTAYASGKWGLNISLSKSATEPTSWNKAAMLLPPVSLSSDSRVDNWDHNQGWQVVNDFNQNRLARYAYTSVIAPEGTMGLVGDEFYIYYAKNPEFRNASNFWLMRRKVRTLNKNSSLNASSMVPLVQYTMKRTVRTKTSIDNPSRTDYQYTGTTLGWLTPQPAPGLVPIFEVYDKGWDDYFIVNEGAIQKSADGLRYECKNGQPSCFVRLLGYVSPVRTALHSIPMGECVNTTTQDHFYVTRETKPGQNSGACPNGRESWTYGWLMPQQALSSGAQPVNPPSNPSPVTPPPTSPPPAPQPGGPDLPVSLVTKKSADGKYKSRLVTAKSQADGSLGNAIAYGKIYSTPGTGRKALHECYLASWDDYMLSTFDTASQPTSFCQNKTPGWSERYTGVVGYVGATSSTVTPRPLQGCFDEVNLNHFYVITTNGCQPMADTISPRGQAKTEWLFGWIGKP